MSKKPSEYVLMRLYDKKINNKKECIIRTVGTFYSFVIKYVHMFKAWFGTCNKMLLSVW